MTLKELKNWLKDCNYIDSVINQSFYYIKLQGPAPFRDNLKNIPFFLTYHKNINNEKAVRKIYSKLANIQSGYLSELFKNTNVILSQKQPKNLLRLLVVISLDSNLV